MNEENQDGPSEIESLVTMSGTAKLRCFETGKPECNFDDSKTPFYIIGFECELQEKLKRFIKDQPQVLSVTRKMIMDVKQSCEGCSSVAEAAAKQPFIKVVDYIISRIANDKFWDTKRGANKYRNTILVNCFQDIMTPPHGLSVNLDKIINASGYDLDDPCESVSLSFSVLMLVGFQFLHRLFFAAVAQRADNGKPVNTRVNYEINGKHKYCCLITKDHTSDDILTVATENIKIPDTAYED